MNNKLLVYFFLICLGLLTSWTLYKEVKGDRIGYVDIEKMVNDYALKKQMEHDAGENLNKIQHAIDSMEMIRKTVGGNTPTLLDTQIVRAKAVYQEYYTASANEMNKQVWNRLNPLLEEYGKEKGIELLIGATGNGSLLYADKGRDLTNDLIEYINRKHEKGN